MTTDILLDILARYMSSWFQFLKVNLMQCQESLLFILLPIIFSLVASLETSSVAYGIMTTFVLLY